MENTVEKICYICGLEFKDYPYDEQSFRANPEVICPCCGTHYGLDDEGAGRIEISEGILSSYKSFGDSGHKKIIKILRQHWIDEGMKWQIPEDVCHPKPNNWDPRKQLENVPEAFK